MSRRITVTTPENVIIEYELGGIASRGSAAVIDLAIQLLCMAILLVARLILTAGKHIPAAGWTNAVLGIVSFIIFYGYYVYFETVCNGQTPGKRIARIRTVKEGGRPIDLACAALRNLIRVIDFLPMLYVVGAISIVLSRECKRLGDFAAGTLVVKERREQVADLKGSAPDLGANYPEAECVRNIELVTVEQFETLKRFLGRKAELAPKVREELAAKIARPIMAHLGIEEDGKIVYSNLLSEIHRQCVEHRGMI